MMETRQDGLALLLALKETLQREKAALLSNDGVAFDSIVTEKQTFLSQLEAASFEGCSRVAVENEVNEIKELQECNVLLTRQAISYHDSILDALSEGMEKNSRTYSKKGQLSPSKKVGLFNQSV